MIDAEVKAAIARLEQENARVRGENLATGVILAQLLQTMCKQQMSPYAFATKIMKDASDAVAAFKPDEALPHEAAMKQSALDTVKHYDEQIRSVLPV